MSRSLPSGARARLLHGAAVAFQEQGDIMGGRYRARHSDIQLEDARMMLEHGIAWSIIADVTGIRSEDLETA